MQHMLHRSIVWIFVASLTLVFTLVLAFDFVRGPQVSITLDEPAPEEIVAPQSINYVSDVLTERERQQAASAVTDQFTPLDLSIARAQKNLVQSVFGYIEVVRSDGFANSETKLENLAAVEGLTIETQVAEDLLDMSNTEFAAAKENILQIVESTMRQGVIDDQLSEARRRAAQGAAFDLTPAQERVVTTIAPQFIVPNIVLDTESTNTLKFEAMENVEPISQNVTEGQRIIRVGDTVDEVALEMLDQLGLLQESLDWRRVVSALLAALLAVTVIALYWNEFFGARKDTARSLAIIGVLMALFLLSAKLLNSNRSVFAYLYPSAALSIIIAVIFEVRLSILVTFVQAGLVGYIAQGSLEMAAYSAVGGLLAVLTLRDVQRINAIFRAGLVAAVGYVTVILIFTLPEGIQAAELLTLVIFGIVNGAVLSSGLGLAGIFIIGSIFRIVTPLQLQELSRLDHPLLQELLRRAPGTYHHSIMVANLAEQAAEKVKANIPLVRVGAFYHDVGKMNRPPFFIENQNGGNPHDNLDPYSSARIIMCHVTDGLELARRYNLPNRIRDFVGEHHGDRVLKSFYHKAMETAVAEEEVDIARFRYPGPKPRSRETGIVQLADSVEATSSALRPRTEEDIEKLVRKIIDEHLEEGQLDESGLSLADVKLIRESFIETLQGRFHVRIRYPGNEELIASIPAEAVVVEGDLLVPASPEIEADPPSSQEEMDASIPG
jgi:putative nucleotidyltransferase with HDIG domain